MRKWRNEDGFSLTELVVSIFLTTVGLLSVAAVLTTAAHRQDISQSITTGTNLCSTKLEEIKNMNYEDIAASVEGFGEIENFTGYRREVLVTPDVGDELKVVKVIVTNHAGFAVTLETAVAR